jgi:hypothetical protein
MKKYQVVVGNLGQVLDTGDREKATICYHDYLAISLSGQGRAGGEPVTMFEDGEIVREYTPSLPPAFIDNDHDGLA